MLSAWVAIYIEHKVLHVYPLACEVVDPLLRDLERVLVHESKGQK